MSQSQQSSSQQSQHSKGSQTNRPRQAPVISEAPLKINPKNKQIVLNLSMTHYDVVADVAEELEWRVQYSSKRGDWDVLWIDSMIEPDTLMKMHFHQKISHFPGIYVLARKNLLGYHFNEMAKKYPQDYNFFPRTWLLPSEFPEFRQEVERSEAERKCYIVKPEADCQGRGIFLTFNTAQVENGRHFVIQQYLSNPFLVDGLKFDFRVYVLLCGTNPMRLYIYEQGLARFATEKYEPPEKSNLKKLFMHLTNYAINKKNPKYIYNNSIHNFSTGHKRTLSSVYKYMERRGFNLGAFKEKLHDMLVKTMIIGQPLISHQYKFAQPDDEYRNMCFHILGIDVMIDECLNPYVLEVNHTPSFVTDTPLDYFVKFNLIKDTLLLMNINQKTKKELIKKTNNYQRERITNVKKLIETEEQKEKSRQAQKERDAYEDGHLGKFTKIYPLQGQDAQYRMQKYEQFLKHAEKVYFNENNVIRMQIQMQRERAKDKDKPREPERDRSKAMSSSGNHSKKSIETNLFDSTIMKKSHRNDSQIKYRSNSEKRNEQLLAKNSSMEISVKQIKQSKGSLLMQNGINSLAPNISSKVFAANAGTTKLANSISEYSEPEEQFTPTSKFHMYKNLPKIDAKPEAQNSPTKLRVSGTETKANKYVNLRKKKIESREEKIRESLNYNYTSSGKHVPGSAAKSNLRGSVASRIAFFSKNEA